MRLDAVLFELEGVLADTAPLRRDALRRSLVEDGVAVADADWPAYVGLAPREAAALAAQRQGTTLDDTALDLAALRAERHFADLIGRGLSLAPGARELVETLAPHARLGIVTRASRRDVELVLGLAELEWAFESVVTADDRARPKPDPAPYELALARLARRRPVERDAVVALEDGPAGITAASAAGLACVAVGALPVHDAMRAAGVLPSLVGVGRDALVRVAGGASREARW